MRGRNPDTFKYWKYRITFVERLPSGFYPLPSLPPTPTGPILSTPGLGQFFNNPSLQPSVFAKSGIQDLLFAEMFLDALGREPTPTTALFSQIKKSGVQMKVIKDLLQQFEEATKVLKIELDHLEKGCKEI